MSKINKKRLQEDEYEIQHYGYSSSEFSDQFLNIITCRIDENLEDLKKSIARKLDLDDIQKEKLDNEILILGNTTKSEAEDHFQSSDFQDKIQDFFKIPDNILLPDDLIHGEDLNGDTVESLTKDIEELEKQYKKDSLLMMLYDQEMESIKSLEPVEELLTNTIKCVKLIPKLSKYEKKVKQNSTKIAERKESLKNIVDMNELSKLSEKINIKNKCILTEELKEY